MLFEDLVCNVKILTVLKLSWDHSDANAAPRKYHAFSFREKGNACYTAGAEQTRVRDGDILFVPENLGYHIKAEHEELYVIHFELTEKKQNCLEVFHVEDCVKAKRLFALCYDVWNQKKPGYYFKCLSIFYNILELMNVSAMDTLMEEDYLKIKPAVNYLHMHFSDSDCSVLKLCSMVQMSDTWFRKLFYKYYGTTPVKYINHLRISHAKELIESGYYKIEQIAEMAGFEDSKYFSTVFKQYTGCSPADYKKQQLLVQ